MLLHTLEAKEAKLQELLSSFCMQLKHYQKGEQWC